MARYCFLVARLQQLRLRPPEAEPHVYASWASHCSPLLNRRQRRNNRVGFYGLQGSKTKMNDELVPHSAYEAVAIPNARNATGHGTAMKKRDFNHSDAVGR